MLSGEKVEGWEWVVNGKRHLYVGSGGQEISEDPEEMGKAMLGTKGIDQ